MKKYSLILCLLFSVLMAQATELRPVHEFHASIAEVRYNPNSKTFEVGVRFFTDDLAAALSKQHDRKVQINKNQDHETLISDYTLRRFSLVGRNNNPLLSSYVGFENQGELTWVYLEIQQGNHNLSTLQLQNTVLFDFFEDQVNTANVFIKDQVFTLVLRAGESEITAIPYLQPGK